jgi:hypothetical protein
MITIAYAIATNVTLFFIVQFFSLLILKVIAHNKYILSNIQLKTPNPEKSTDLNVNAPTIKN